MDGIKTNGGCVKNNETELTSGLTLIQECITHQKDILSYITSFRTNHTYERLEKAIRKPSFIDNPQATNRKIRIHVVNSERLLNEDSRVNS